MHTHVLYLHKILHNSYFENGGPISLIVDLCFVYLEERHLRDMYKFDTAKWRSGYV